jgi:diguanylate cyclase (GGDEF)-like protein
MERSPRFLGAAECVLTPDSGTTHGSIDGHDEHLSAREEEELLRERAINNLRVTTRVSALALLGAVVMLAQHLIAPAESAPHGSPLWQMYTTVYVTGCLIALVFTILSRVGARRRYATGLHLSLTFAVVFVVALAALALVASWRETNVAALTLGIFVLASMYRAKRRFYVTTIVATTVSYVIGQIVIWHQLRIITFVLAAIIITFSLYVSASMESQRVQAFRARHALDRKNRVLAQLSATDPLTGVMNRRTMENHLSIHMDEFVRYRACFSLVMVDIDHFKRINDTYGHPVGDEVLVELAALLSESLRTSDEVARFGGEEFVLILPHTYVEKAQTVAERLRVSIETQRFSSRELSISASFGVAQAEEGEDRFDELVRRADSALYDAKNSGRNAVVTA